MDIDNSTAWLGGYLLEIETIEDSFEKAIAVHEIPYSDGALTEDLGLKARRIKFRCYFFGERYELHRNFLNHLEGREISELIHPKYGLVKGRIESVAVRHDDRIKTAEIDISFVEHLRGSLEVARRRPDVKSESEAAYDKGLAEARDAVKNDAVAALGAEGASIASQVLTAGQTALSQLTGLSRAGRAWVKTIDRAVSRLEAELTEIANPANSFIAAIDFGVNLPGRVIGAIARCAERYCILFDALTTAPEQFMQNFRDAMTDLANRIGCEDHVHHVASLQAAAALAAIFAADEARRDTARVLEKTASFDALGTYVKATAAPDLLDVRQIERALAVANALLQAAVSRDRTLQAPKDLARILTEHAVQVKLEAEKLVTIHVDHPTPLHLLCLQRGLPYNYAERIIKVNDIPNPNQVHGAVQVYVR